MLTASRDQLESIDDWNAENIQAELNSMLEQTGQKPMVLFSLIRIATTQSPASPALAGSLELLTKQRVISRINQQIEAFASNT